MNTGSSLTIANVDDVSFLDSKNNTELELNTFGTTIKIIGKK